MRNSSPGFLLFSGSSHGEFSRKVADKLGVSLGQVEIKTFPDEEIGVLINENVRGRDVFVLQTIARRPHSYLMELLIMVDALKRASARSITAVMPYYGYARQDRREEERTPITARLVADLLQAAGVHRVLTMDLHTEQIQGFFDIPVDNLHSRYVFVKHLRTLLPSCGVVVAPDVGASKNARRMADQIGYDLAIVDKRRATQTGNPSLGLIGQVKGKPVLIVDDICSTGETLQIAASVCKASGAEQIHAVVTHGMFAGEKWKKGAIDKFWVTDTIPLLQPEARVEVVSVAGYFSQAIQSIVDRSSLQGLQPDASNS